MIAVVLIVLLPMCFAVPPYKIRGQQDRSTTVLVYDRFGNAIPVVYSMSQNSVIHHRQYKQADARYLFTHPYHDERNQNMMRIVPRPLGHQYQDDDFSVYLNEELVNSYEPEWYREMLWQQKKQEELEIPKIGGMEVDNNTDDDDLLSNQLTTLSISTQDGNTVSPPESSDETIVDDHMSDVEEEFMFTETPRAGETKLRKRKERKSTSSSNDSIKQPKKVLSSKEQRKIEKQRLLLRKQQERLGIARQERELREKYQQLARQQYLESVERQLELKHEEELKSANEAAVEVISSTQDSSSHEESDMTMQKLPQDTEETVDMSRAEQFISNEPPQFKQSYFERYLKKNVENHMSMKRYFKAAGREMPYSLEDKSEEIERLTIHHGDEMKRNWINNFIDLFFGVQEISEADHVQIVALGDEFKELIKYFETRYQKTKKSNHSVYRIFNVDYFVDQKGNQRLRAFLNKLRPQMDLFDITVGFAKNALSNYDDLHEMFGQEVVDRFGDAMDHVRQTTLDNLFFLERFLQLYVAFKNV